MQHEALANLDFVFRPYTRQDQFAAVAGLFAAGVRGFVTVRQRLLRNLWKNRFVFIFCFLVPSREVALDSSIISRAGRRFVVVDQVFEVIFQF